MLRKTGFSTVKTHISGGFFHVVTHIIELVFKHAIHKRPIFPDSINNIIEKEHVQGGFANIHIIARKTLTP